MRLIVITANLMQRLSSLPATPDITLLDLRKSKPHPRFHTDTTFRELTYIDGVASTCRMHRGYRKSGTVTKDGTLRTTRSATRTFLTWGESPKAKGRILIARAEDLRSKN